MHSQRIKDENRLAYSILRESLYNESVKKVLKDIATILIARVLDPLRAVISKTTQFSDLDKSYQALLSNLAAEHSAERRQYGAALPKVPLGADLLKSIDSINEFLDKQEDVLRHIDDMTSVDEMAVVLKIMVELGYTYYEAPNEWHSEKFDFIKSMISPTAEEIDIRLFRNELGETPRFALSYGIGTEKNDLGDQSEGVGRSAGKSVFGKVSMQARLTYIVSEYDKTKSEQMRKKMEHYRIPLNIEEREAIDVYIDRWTTFFEKLAHNPVTYDTSPLIASVSRATARLLVSLHDMGAFSGDDKFNLNKLQIFSNLVMGFIVHAGHHSIAEVGEVYNRLIDTAAIECIDSHKKPIIPGNKEKRLEELLPYFRYGDNYSFFHRSFAGKMITIVNEGIDVTPDEMGDSAFGRSSNTAKKHC